MSDAPPSVSAAPPPADHYEQELSRSLSLTGNVLITLSAVTPASSVFIIIPAVLLAIGGASFLAFLGAAVVGVCMALCYAELSTAFPIAGGEFSWVGRILGKATGFALFLMNTLSLMMIIGVIALGTGEYLAAAFSAANSKWVGVAVIVICAFVAILNIRTNAWVTGIFLVLEMGALVVLCVLGFTHVSRGVDTLWVAQTVDSHGTLVGVGAGLVVAQMATAIFAYNGYGAAIYFAEETRGASKVLGRVILVSLGVAVAAEIIPMVAVLLGAPSMHALLSAPSPMEYFVTSRGSHGLNTVVSLAIAIAIINATVAITLQAGRTLWAAARDGAFPDIVGRKLAYVHPKLQTPIGATLFVGFAAAAIASAVPLNSLIIATGATLVILYLLVALAVIAGRRSGRTAHAAYRMPLYPLAPIVAIASLVYVAKELWQANPWQLIIALAGLVIGFVYYVIYLRPRSDTRWTMSASATAEDEDVTPEIGVGPIAGLEEA